MRHVESQKSHIGLPVDSPLQQIAITGTDSDVYLKREDLLLPAGGNKVRRLVHWFTKHKNSHTIVAMSDPGAHTFKVLKAFLDSQYYIKNVKRMIFLETSRNTNPYSEVIKQEYFLDKRISIIRGPVISQFLLLKLFGVLPGFASLGVGGSVKSTQNPFTRALEEVHRSSPFQTFNGRTTHIFPIASGTMLDGFLMSPLLKSREIKFTGIMSGNPITFRYLKKKYRTTASCELLPSIPVKWSDYLEKAHIFYDKTGVWLDPMHTIHLLDTKEIFRGTKSEKKVLWITNPKIESDPSNHTFNGGKNG